jgi:CheY-like chemotaxis protein
VRFRIEISAYLIRYHRSECRLFLVRDLSPRALIVDDNSVVRNMTALLFRKLGYSVVTADSAENAVRVFRKGGFAVVLTDVVMPQVDGVELAARLRAMDSTLPILLMSGYSDVQIPLDEYSRLMKKPFGIEDLSRGLANLPERARAGLM